MHIEQHLSKPQIRIVAGLLAALMFFTRSPIFHLSIDCANASMAVFFLGGLYVRRHWVFASLVLLAVGIDYATIVASGGENYCITTAYGFLLLSYAVLWYGGRWLAARTASRWTQFGGALVCAALAFLISNGSFYWFSGRVVDPGIRGWVANFTQWALLFIGSAVAYIGVVLLAHELWERARGRRSAPRAA